MVRPSNLYMGQREKGVLIFGIQTDGFVCHLQCVVAL